MALMGVLTPRSALVVVEWLKISYLLNTPCSSQHLQKEPQSNSACLHLNFSTYTFKFPLFQVKKGS